MAEVTAAAPAAEISTMAEENPVHKEEPGSVQIERSEAPEEEEAKEAPPSEEALEENSTDHKRKLEDLENEAAEKKDADLEPVESTGEIGDTKRQKVDEDADEFAVDGAQVVQITETPVVENGQLPLSGDVHPGSVEISEKPEAASQDGILPSAVGNDAPSSHKIEVPNNKVGVLIGKSGETIRNLQRNSGAQIQITRDAQADPNSSTRPVELIGTLEQVHKAEKLIKDVIAEADAGGSPALIAQGYGASQSGSEVYEMQVPNEKVGIIIGKGGETIKNLQTTSGARIQLIPQHLPEGDVSKERTVRVTGNKRQIEAAKEMIKDVMNKVPIRSSSSGGNSQSYRPHGPGTVPQWAPRGPLQPQNQPHPTAGFDYQQRGTCPPPPLQYPQSYGGGYQQQPAPRSNVSAGWEQRPGAAAQAPPPGGYNYYGQGGQTQQSTAVPVQNYGQSQAPPYGQTNPYVQSGTQQSYGPGYSEPKYDNQAPPPQTYGQQQPPTSHPGFYPQQGSTTPQPGYVQPQPYGNPAPQSYGPPRASQPGEPMYQGPVPSYGPAQQPNLYDGSAPQAQPAPAYGQQTYGPTPPVGADGYNQPPSAGYAQPGSQVAPGYGQGGGQPGAQSGGYGQYAPAQPSYVEQALPSNVNYGYQGAPGCAGYNNANPNAAYGAAPPVSGSQPGYPQAGGYAQPAANPASYDQSAGQQYGYGSQPGSVPVGYANGAAPQPGGYAGWTA